MRKLFRIITSLFPKKEVKPVVTNVETVTNVELSDNNHLSKLFQKQLSDVMKINTELVEMMNDESIDPKDLDGRISEKLKQDPTVVVIEKNGLYYENKMWVVCIGNIFVRERPLTEEETIEYKNTGTIKSMRSLTLEEELEEAIQSENYEKCIVLKEKINSKS